MWGRRIAASALRGGLAMRLLLVWLSVLFSVLSVNVPAALAQEPPRAHAPGTADDEENAGPVKVKMGVLLESLSGFDAAKGTFSAEFVVFIQCEKEPCKPHIEAVNAKGPLSKPEKLLDEKLHKVWKYKAEFNALVDFEQFPFDEHVLPIVLEDSSDPDEVTWELDKTTTDFDHEKCKVPGFKATHWVASVEKDDVGGGQKVSQLHYGVVIERAKFSSFMSNLLPAIVMALFVFGATLFMKPKAAQARLAGISGSLLALVMFHKSAIPAGATITLLDKFMLATYLLYVFNILFTVLMLRAEDQKKERKGELAYLIAWGVVPGLALVFWTIVFSGLV
jgi:hypothetical protein